MKPKRNPGTPVRWRRGCFRGERALPKVTGRRGGAVCPWAWGWLSQSTCQRGQDGRCLHARLRKLASFCENAPHLSKGRRPSPHQAGHGDTALGRGPGEPVWKAGVESGKPCSTGSPKGHVCRDSVLPPLPGGRWKRGLCVTKTRVSETSVGRMGRCATGAGFI